MTQVELHKDNLERGFRVGEYYVEPDQQRISVGADRVQVEPKVMEVLLFLAENQGRTVSKERFMNEVWGGTVVTDDALLRCISELRKVFNDDPRSPAYIETIRKKGYRLIAPVRERDLQQAQPAAGPRTTAEREIRWPLVWAAVSATAVLTVLVIALLEPVPETAPVRPLRTIPITSYPGEEVDPSISPDGDRIAFAWDRGEGEGLDVYVKQIGVATPVRLTSAPGDEYSPTWAPDGTSLLFIRERDGEYSLFSKPSVGGSEREIANVGARQLRSASVSPDGGRVALSLERAARERFAVALMDLGTLARHELTEPPSDYFGDIEPVFSPNGDRIAFIRRVVEKVDDIYVVPSSGGDPVRITFDHAEVTGLDWSPDGSDLIFTSNREGTSTLWRVPSSGGTPVWIPTSGEGSGIYQISVARARKRMAVVQRSEDTNIWSMSVHGSDSGKVVPIVASTRMDGDADVSPDGSRIVYISNRLGDYELWMCHRDGSNPVQLTTFGGPFVSSPRWDPEGRRVAFVARGEGQIDVYIVDVVGGTVSRLTTADSNDREPHWSRDARWIYFTSNRGGDWDIWKRPVGGGDAVKVTHDGGFTAMESVGGEWIFFVKRDLPGLWRMPSRGGKSELVVPGVDPYDAGNWSVDSTGIYYVQRLNGLAQVMHVPEVRGTPRVAASIPNLPKSSALAVAPGGRSLLYTRQDRSDSDVLLVEDFE